jgi:hypothetical protein
MRRPARQSYLFYRRPAAGARLRGLLVHTKLVLVTTGLIITIKEVADRGTVFGDSPLEHGNDSRAQAIGLFERGPAAKESRRQARLEKRLIGVNVPNAGDNALIKENRLQTAACLAKLVRKLGACEIPWLWPKPLTIKDMRQFVGPVPAERTEPARIVETEFAVAVLKPENHMRMHSQRRLFGREHQAAGHPEMGEQAAILIQVQNNPFPAAGYIHNSSAADSPAPRGLPAAAQRFADDPDFANDTAPEPGAQHTDNRLDFRQFRHACSSHSRVALYLPGSL